MRLFGVPLGVLAAVKRGSIADQVVRVVGLIGYSVPVFWLALLALLFFYAKLHWVAYPGRIDVSMNIRSSRHRFYSSMRSCRRVEIFWDLFRHIILPASLLVISRWPISAV